MSRTELDRWQHLAPMALVFLIVNGGAKFVRENLFLFAGAGAGFAFLDRLGFREFLLGGLVALLGAVVAAMIYHRRFRFRVEGDAIRLRRGIIENKDLRVRFARIQNVGLSQPIYFRPFGLVRFTVETPGAETTEVSLPGISRELARALRDHIARHGGKTISDEQPSAGETGPPEGIGAASGIVHRPGSARLFAHGLVSNQVWLIAGVAAWLWGTMWERIEQWIESLGVSALLQRILEVGWMGAAGMLIGLVVVLFAVSGLLSLVRFHDFQLRDLDDRLVAQGGLLDKREQTIGLEKLTGLTLHQTALGRLFGLWYLVGKQAGSKEAEGDPGGEQFMVPGLRRADLGRVLGLVPGLSLPDRFRPISRRFRSLFWTRTSAVVAAVAGMAWWQLPDFRLAVAGVLVVLLIVLWLIHRSWKCWGWRIVDGICWVRQGTFSLRYDAFDLARV
ncbi:MAG: PH domain-containing protein [Wenzhouxiangella sp.]